MEGKSIKEKESMPIGISNYPVHLQDGLKPDRECLKSQESQKDDLKVFHRDSLEVSQLSKNREILMEKMKHTVMHSVTAFSDTRAEILKEIREEKGQYGYCDVVNACGLSYVRLYAEIEQRHESEAYYKADGTSLTKEEEIAWLDVQYEQEAEWQKSCARIAAQGEVIQGNITEMPTKEIEELEDSFYQAKDAYMKLYRESRQTGKPLALQNYVFSKKKSGISEEEYRRQIREQAYEDFAKGQFQNKSEGFNRLMKNYTSEVSPDRKGIITSGLKAVSKNGKNVSKPIDFVATLLEGKVKYQKLPSGSSDYIEFYDKSGEMVATYSNNGWTMYTTNAEASRQTEMCMIYNEAWGNAKRGIPLAGEETVNAEDMQNRFDAKA